MSSILQVTEIAKSFGPTVALRNLSLELARGEIRALLGENGAGKSTFVKMLSGLLRPDHGAIRLEGQDYLPRSAVEAHRHGVSTAYQELSLVPHNNVAENFFLAGALGEGVVYRKKAAFVGTRKILEDFGIEDIGPDAMVGSLSLAQKQRLEIARTLSQRPRLLILDEPTAALPDPEWLYGYVEELAAKGTGVLFISHRLAEVRRLCDTVTVLRGGESVYTAQLSEASDDVLFEAMVGRSLGKTLSSRRQSATARDADSQAVLEINDFAAGQASVDRLTVYAGEIVGIAALEGQGQKDLFSAIAGVSRPTTGALSVNGTPIAGGGIARRLSAGLVYLPEERKTEGIFSGLLTEANISISSLMGLVGKLGLVNSRLERGRVSSAAERVSIDSGYIRRPIERLSGGNQQKALLARALMTEPKCLLLFDPTRGVDIGTKQTMYSVMEAFSHRGGGVLFYSTDLQELVHFAHRVLVMYRGRIVSELRGEDIREELLVRRICGYLEDTGESANVVA